MARKYETKEKRAAARGRSRGTPTRATETDVPLPLDEDLVVRAIPLSQVDPDDETYRFRAVVRVGDLVKSIREHGQQIPAVVRPHPHTDRGYPYQLISGFRRVTALRELGVPTLSAYVRRDLVTDGDAFAASVLENVARRTYSDIDRAYIIRRHRDGGLLGLEVARLMNLGERQMRNLASLLELPEAAQHAIGDPDAPFKTTHALTLKALSADYPDLPWAEFITMVNNEDLSVTQLRRRVNERYRQRGRRPAPSLFRPEGTALDQGRLRFNPVAIDTATLSPDDRQRLVNDLRAALRVLEA
jgi:ParB/RepB/Spo0J family partition protein